MLGPFLLGSIKIKTRISNYGYNFIFDGITYPCFNPDASLIYRYK